MQTKVINQAFGRSWAMYQGDCVQVLKGLPDKSVHFSVYSPPFANLYIYSVSIADMGNSANPVEFMAHYRYLLKELRRVMVKGGKLAIHIKDLPLFKVRDEVMGLLDLPGMTIQAHESEGMRLVGWYTIWKDPVIEMQRTKNAGLLWSEAFCKRAERARQGMADYVLLFELTDKAAPKVEHTPLVPSVIERLMDLWMNLGERLITPQDTQGEEQAGLWIVDQPQETLTTSWIESELLPNLMDGRNLVCHVCDPRDMQVLIERMAPYRMVFHSRVALTDGTWLVVFRKWLADMPDSHVTHDLVASEHEFVGSDGPRYWDDDRDYSIQVWQRYASPVWYDLEGLPASHPSIWMDIDQTDVLNFQVAREAADEKHICPLQIGLIERCVQKWSKPNQVVLSPFAGIGSEIVGAVKLGRYGIGVELKDSYFAWGLKYLRNAEKASEQMMIPAFAELMAMA